MNTNILSRVNNISKDRDNQQYTLLQICRNCRTEPEFVISAVQYHILHPQGDRPIHWRFSAQELSLLQTIISLKRNYDLNMTGIEYVVNLLEMNKALRKKLQRVEQALSSNDYF